jgi:signal transduction histidine kinase
MQSTRRKEGKFSPISRFELQKTESNELLIQVIDNGPGIEDPERIFDAFVITKKTGMGMGLAISRSIIEANGGGLWAENGAEGRATFSVALPPSAGQSNPTSSQSRHSDSNSRRIVHVPIR